MGRMQGHSRNRAGASSAAAHRGGRACWGRWRWWSRYVMRKNTVPGELASQTCRTGTRNHDSCTRPRWTAGRRSLMRRTVGGALIRQIVGRCTGCSLASAAGPLPLAEQSGLDTRRRGGRPAVAADVFAVVRRCTCHAPAMVLALGSAGHGRRRDASAALWHPASLPAGRATGAPLNCAPA